MANPRRLASARRLLLVVSGACSVLAACSAGAVQRDAVCGRSAALDVAVSRIGELPSDVRSMNASVLRSQLDEDIANLTVALDVAPRSIAGDLSSISDRLLNLYGALELLDWDPVRFVSDERLADELTTLASVNTRRHLARITDYLLTSCSIESGGALPPPDSIVAVPVTSTSIASSADDPIPADQDLLTAHVAMGSAIAESLKVTVSVEQAECLGREADAVSVGTGSVSADNVKDGNYDSLFASIFVKCGVSVPDQPAP